MLRRVSLSLLCIVLSVSTSAREINPEQLPEALQDWQTWVAYQREFTGCPFINKADYGKPGNHLCAWPETLNLTINDTGGRFSIRWQLLEESVIPLPGGKHWPLQVQVDGQAVPVLNQNGQPSIKLSAGEHTINGRFNWNNRPQSIRVPAQIGLFELQVGNRQVALPLIREGQIWLGEDQTRREENREQIQISRQIVDGIPTILDTLIRLDISGRTREIVLPNALLNGFKPVNLNSRLPFRIQPDGSAIVQGRSGQWTLKIRARATTALNSIELGQHTAASSNEEIWAYQTMPRLRITQAEGRAVDANQVYTGWPDLPNFALRPGEQLSISEQGRGMNPEEGNRLHLQRISWLDFSGQGLTSKDRITGQMRKDWRLSIQQPFELQYAKSSNFATPALITTQPENLSSGIEVRDPSPDIDALVRLNTWSGKRPINGWQHRFESVRETLYLPPGYRLLEATGSEQGSRSWRDEWRLLDMFLALIFIVAAWHLTGLRGALVAIPLMLLGFHATEFPYWALFATLLLALLGRNIQRGKLATAVSWGYRAAVLVAAIQLGLFALQEIKLAVYPQLEYGDIGLSAGVVSSTSPTAASPMVDEVVERFESAQSKARRPANLEQDMASGSRKKRADLLNQMQEGAIPQVGNIRPDWQWQSHRLRWSGPVTADETTRLLILPPWMTAIWRLLTVILAASLLVFSLNLSERLGRLRKSTASAILISLFCCGSLYAQTTPDQELLNELQKRLDPSPDCPASCLELAQAQISISGNTLSLQMEWHVAAASAAALPEADINHWRIQNLRVNNRPHAAIYSLQQPRVLLQPGVHRITVRGTILDVDSLNLRFPVKPHWITVSAGGWQISGLNQNRLLGDNLQLNRQAQSQQAQNETSVQIQPFLRLQRNLTLDRNWSMENRLTRIAPQHGAITVRIPNRNSEITHGDAVIAEGNELLVTIPDGVRSVTWSSQLAIEPELQLPTLAQSNISESWKVVVSPIWRVRFSGLPAVMPEHLSDYWEHEFHPLSGELLQLSVQRLEAIVGETLSFDNANLSEQIGKRARSGVLNAVVHTSRSLEHSIELPAEAEVGSVKINNRPVYARFTDGQLPLQLAPGRNSLQIEYRIPRGVTGITQNTPIQMHAPASNLRQQLSLPNNRWVLATWGQGIGPAVLYWSILLGWVVLSWVLAKINYTPLKFHHWLLLSLGFSTISWHAFVLVAFWLHAVAWRQKNSPSSNPHLFNLAQLMLIGITAFACLVLLAVVPYGLLGQPDMHISGVGSNVYQLRRFLDHSDGSLPMANVLSLPLWVYQAAILLWALWLATTVIKWLRWSWQALNRGEFWAQRKVVKTQPDVLLTDEPAE